jgi:hypothetical protein
LTEIEVTDPTHPLFGRRFPVLSISSPPQGAGSVLVQYREHMALRIPVLATNLASARSAPQTKLTLEAVAALVALAVECEVLCPSNPPKSGDDCRQHCSDASSMI